MFVYAEQKQEKREAAWVSSAEKVPDFTLLPVYHNQRRGKKEEIYNIK